MGRIALGLDQGRLPASMQIQIIKVIEMHIHILLSSPCVSWYPWHRRVQIHQYSFSKWLTSYYLQRTRQWTCKALYLRRASGKDQGSNYGIARVNKESNTSVMPINPI